MTTTARRVPRRARTSLLAYRVMAYVTGALLCVLVFVAIPLKYGANVNWPVAIFGTAHGFLFIVYLITALNLGVIMRWNPFRLVIIMICGTIPILTFVAERNTTRHARAAGV